MKALRRLLLVIAAASPFAAQAQLWGYVDGAGVAHIARSQLDSRYRLVLGDAAPSTPRVPGKTDGAGGLLTWLEFAPEVKRLQPLLREAATAHGVDVELLKALIAVESGFNPKAVSPRGAVGLMQITPATADRYATHQEVKQPAAERLLDPRINVFTGARMLADLTRRFGRIDVALAAWNAGEGTVRKHGGEMPPIAETRAHVHLVLELYWALLQNNLQRGAHQLKVQRAASAP
ncbi:membrane-bound lytic murein transglycosylase E [Burkholderiaceae bacterium]|nr:membrane-bound lytic murein transglycosylase E [Burkholderiaceae bacterium]